MLRVRVNHWRDQWPLKVAAWDEGFLAGLKGHGANLHRAPEVRAEWRAGFREGQRRERARLEGAAVGAQAVTA